jgi:hypothetical protein
VESSEQTSSVQTGQIFINGVATVTGRLSAYYGNRKFELDVTAGESAVSVMGRVLTLGRSSGPAIADDYVSEVRRDVAIRNRVRPLVEELPLTRPSPAPKTYRPNGAREIARRTRQALRVAVKHWTPTRHAGFVIRACDDGFYWQEGGYFATADEARADIGRWNESELAAEHDDTPCLDDSFRRGEMET